MCGKRLFSRVLMAVTFVVAALFLAPSGALAHAGHGHEAPAASVTKPAAADAQVLNFVPISVQAEAALGRIAVASLVPRKGPEMPQSCPGGCCHLPGIGCCAAWLPELFEIRIPVLDRSALVVAVVGGAGITPGVLPEPPKSLV